MNISGELIIPNSVNEIGVYAFRFCLNITSLKFSSSIDIIKENAFDTCTEISFITFQDFNTIPSYWENNFKNWKNEGMIYLTGSVDKSEFKTFLHSKGLPEGWKYSEYRII